MSLEVIIDRFDKGKDQTLGFLFVLKDNELKLKLSTLELPWRENKNRISCIPVGIYPVKRRYSKKHGEHFHILNVPGRSLILIHSMNYSRQSLGCIAPGLDHRDIDHDGLKDVTSSRIAMRKLNEILPNEFEIEIK